MIISVILPADLSELYMYNKAIEYGETYCACLKFVPITELDIS